MGPEGYKEAVKMPRDRVGNTQDHMDEQIGDLMSGSLIKDYDIKGPQGFIDKLWDTVIGLDIAGRRNDLDSFGIITQLSRRLTGKLRERYENQLHKHKGRSATRPGIQWFRDLLEDYARKLRERLGNVSEKVEGHDKPDTKGTKSKATDTSRSPVRKGKAIAFASVSG